MRATGYYRVKLKDSDWRIGKFEEPNKLSNGRWIVDGYVYKQSDFESIDETPIDPVPPPLKELVKVHAVQDDSCHWYIIPSSLKSQFYIDSENEDMCDSGEFDQKYGQYRTGGSINQIQLFANL